MEVSVVQLKNQLSKYLELSIKGEEVVVTSYRKPVVRLLPIQKEQEDLYQWCFEEDIHWSSGKPKLVKPSIKLKKHKSLSQIILENRE